MTGVMTQTLTRAQALARAKDQASIRCVDAESAYAKRVAYDAISFIIGSPQAVYTVEEVDEMLDW